MADDELLYHYTTVESLLGIIKSREMWATHIRYLNDTSEQQLLWEQVRAGIESRLQNADDIAMLERLTELQKLAAAPPDDNTYVISFSKDGGDRLSQWRGYGGVAGVAIGFNIPKLRDKCPVTHTHGATLRPVVYIDPSGDGVTHAMVDHMIRGINEQSFSQVVSFAAAGLKHVAFEDEEEWRILVYNFGQGLETRFRYRKSMMVPYVPFDLGNEAWPLVSRVVVGPSPHEQETIAAIKKMLGDSVQVVGSKIPYRDW